MNTNEKNLVVRQSNHLIRALYRISSKGEGRLIRMLIAQISPKDEDFKTYRIAVADFARYFGLAGGSAYESIERAAKTLAHTPISIKSERGWLYMSWLSSAEYIRGNGHVELRFDAKLKPYLLQLKGYFSEYPLENIRSMKGTHSVRLYELLKSEQFKSNETGQFQVPFEYAELRAIVGIEKDEYKFFKDFRLYVVEAAQKEINANADIRIVQVDYPKTGRKVSGVVFHCEPQKQVPIVFEHASPATGEKTEVEAPEDVRELMAMGIDEATAYRWRKKYGAKRIARNAAYAQAMQKAGKIKQSLSGYLSRAIADDIASGWEAEHKKKTEEKKRASDAEERARREAGDQAQARREEREALLAEFHALPESEQDAARAAFAASDKFAPFARWWDKAKADGNGRPETLPQTVVIFCAFYAAYKSGSRDAT